MVFFLYGVWLQERLKATDHVVMFEKWLSENDSMELHVRVVESITFQKAEKTNIWNKFLVLYSWLTLNPGSFKFNL